MNMQIIRVVNGRSKANWGLSAPHLPLLIDAFPESCALLETLLTRTVGAGEPEAKRRKLLEDNKEPASANPEWANLTEMTLKGRDGSRSSVWKLLPRHLQLLKRKAARAPENSRPAACYSFEYGITNARCVRMRCVVKKGDLHGLCLPSYSLASRRRRSHTI